MEKGCEGVIPGSHKANLPCQQSMKGWERYQEHVVDVHAKAGDAVIFTETADPRHSLPRNGDHQRRALLYKFSPGFQAYSAGAHEIAYPAYIEDMKEEERAVMEAPSVRRN
jgi:ectoine hydroxylase-related dioxygenase (phytanoyl-CoA dioxygenase family)